MKARLPFEEYKVHCTLQTTNRQWSDSLPFVTLRVTIKFMSPFLPAYRTVYINTVLVFIWLPGVGVAKHLPNVNDLSLAASMLVVVQDNVTISPIELSVGGGVHGHLVPPFNAPDLWEKR